MIEMGDRVRVLDAFSTWVGDHIRARVGQEGLVTSALKPEFIIVRFEDGKEYFFDSEELELVSKMIPET